MTPARGERSPLARRAGERRAAIGPAKRSSARRAEARRRYGSMRTEAPLLPGPRRSPSPAGSSSPFSRATKVVQPFPAAGDRRAVPSRRHQLVAHREEGRRRAQSVGREGARIKAEASRGAGRASAPSAGRAPRRPRPGRQTESELEVRKQRGRSPNGCAEGGELVVLRERCTGECETDKGGQGQAHRRPPSPPRPAITTGNVPCASLDLERLDGVGTLRNRSVRLRSSWPHSSRGAPREKGEVSRVRAPVADGRASWQAPPVRSAQRVRARRAPSGSGIVLVGDEGDDVVVNDVPGRLVARPRMAAADSWSMLAVLGHGVREVFRGRLRCQAQSPCGSAA